VSNVSALLRSITVTSRVTRLRHHPTQQALIDSTARFNVVPAGRRSGKTEIAKRKIVYRSNMVDPAQWPDARFFAAAPTRDQAKAIYWQDLKALIAPRFLREAPRETDLIIPLWNGADICVIGMDRPERIEGRPWNGGVLDEYANMKPSAWGENVRPALSDRKGWCDLIGVPEGRNHYYDVWKYAIGSGDPEWAGFTWYSADILPPEEIESARRSLDELTFQQEYEGSFINFEGRAYYPFQEATHCAPLTYDRAQPLSLCFDFNVEPGVAVICQEQKLPGGAHGTGVIGEVHIPRNSNTPAVCRKLVSDWGRHEGKVRLYGDATGGARGSARVQGSDWDLIRAELRSTFGDRAEYRVPLSNPPERSRINSVNTRLRSGDGTIRLMVDPAKAPNVVKDLEGVRLLAGGSGEIDKKADGRLTHLSDALGYYIVKEFPVLQKAVFNRELF
jgi:hypothetical protein